MDKVLEIVNLIIDFPRILQRNRLNFIKKENEVGNIWSFHFEKPRGFKIKAGEHLLLQLKHENQDSRGSIRFYSPSSAPHEDTIRITTRYFGDKSSSYKKNLFRMKEGDKIVSMGPIGKFTVKKMDKEYMFITSGVGITPFRSILLDLAKRGQIPRIHLYYYNRGKDILFKDELDSLNDDYAQLNINYLDDEQPLPTDLIERLEEKKGLYYIAGAPSFVESKRNYLKDKGVSGMRIKFDPFKEAKSNDVKK